MIKTSRVVWRLLILATLTGCLLFVATDQKLVAAATDCTACDGNYNTCESGCGLEFNICVNSGNPASTCFQTTIAAKTFASIPMRSA